MAAWRYESSLLVLKKHSERNFVSPRGHVISSIYWRHAKVIPLYRDGARDDIDNYFACGVKNSSPDYQPLLGKMSPHSFPKSLS